MTLRKVSSNLTLCDEQEQDKLLRQQVSKRRPINRDPLVWDANGDCLVYLFPEGKSLRGPAFRISRSLLIDSGCDMLLRACKRVVPSLSSNDKLYHLFLPAPELYLSEDAFQFHLITRNLFRCLVHKPLVGERLGSILIDITERLRDWNGSIGQSLDLVYRYMKSQGYDHLTGDPQAALASLQFAEHFQLNALWTEAFVNCVGMFPRVEHQVQYQHQSHQTQDQLRWARVEMDIRMETAKSFLEDFDSLPLNIHQAITPLQYGHIHSFNEFLAKFWRSFKHSSAAPKDQQSLYADMQWELQSLYEHLANSGSQSMNLKGSKKIIASTLHILSSFDTRNSYKPLPYKLPILPSNHGRMGRKWPLNGFSHTLPTSKDKRTEPAFKTALRSNCATIRPSLLVYRYSQFEQQTVLTDNNLTAQDSRLLNWTVIYAVLQTLLWVKSAPYSVAVNNPTINFPTRCRTAGDSPFPSTCSKPTKIPSSSMRYQGTITGIENTDMVLPPIVPLRTTSRRQSSCTQLDRHAPMEALTDHSMGTPVAERCAVYDRPGYSEILVAGYGNGMCKCDIKDAWHAGDSPRCDPCSRRGSYAESQSSSGRYSRRSIGDNRSSIVSSEPLPLFSDRASTSSTRSSGSVSLWSECGSETSRR